MGLLKKGSVLKRSDLMTNGILDLEGVELVRTFNLKEPSPPVEIVKIKGNKYLVRREGRCDSKKCNSFCCKFFCLKCNLSWKSYMVGFSDKFEGTTATFNKKCKNLSKVGKCKVWGIKKKFPVECQEFPLVHDTVYIKAMSKCTFRFVIEEVIQ